MFKRIGKDSYEWFERALVVVLEVKGRHSYATLIKCSPFEEGTFAVKRWLSPIVGGRKKFLKQLEDVTKYYNFLGTKENFVNRYSFQDIMGPGGMNEKLNNIGKGLKP